MRRTIRRDTRRPGPLGWSNQAGVRPARRSRQGLHAIVLMIPLLVGMLGASVSPQVARGDELSDAKAKAAQLKKQVAEQKARVAALNDLQAGLAAEISDTKHQLRAIGADLTAVKKKIVKMEARIELVKAAYADLVEQVKQMDAQLTLVIAQEAAKRVELSERRALLADRVRNAYDTDRTSPLETFLSGGTFTDLLAEMSYYIDVGEQDQALADQITRDKETLAAMHQTVLDTRIRTNLLRQETAAQKRALDKSLLELKETKKELARLQRAVAKTLAAQKARYAAVKRSRANAAAIIRQAAADQRRLAKEINSLIARQVSRGNIPSKFNGTMRWPMDEFNVSGNYGCSSFAYYAPGNGCAHYPQRHRPRGALRHQGQGRRRRDRRLCRLELGGRRRPRVGRGDRALGLAQDLVRPHAAQAPRVGRPDRQEGHGHRLRGQHRQLDRRPPPLDGRVQRHVREPAPVPVTAAQGRTFTQP